MPGSANRILDMLGLSARDPGPDDLDWGRLEPGASLGSVTPLFPRVEKKKETTVSDTPPPSPKEETDTRVDIADFARLELRAAKITAAEKIEGSKKLIKMQVDLGSETRQVVAGIAQTHGPEDLVGKTVVLVANLKPARLMGVESNGMVLAGSVGGNAVLCVFEDEVAPGTKVK
jgi:methionyl-tRNA synthetase